LQTKAAKKAAATDADAEDSEAAETKTVASSKHKSGSKHKKTISLDASSKTPATSGKKKTAASTASTSQPVKSTKKKAPASTSSPAGDAQLRSQAEPSPAPASASRKRQRQRVLTEMEEIEDTDCVSAVPESKSRGDESDVTMDTEGDGVRAESASTSRRFGARRARIAVESGSPATASTADLDR
jgi:hypothetical protein